MPVGYEALCLVCGESFNPGDENDLIHIRKDDETECGGQGIMVGEWS